MTKDLVRNSSNAVENKNTKEHDQYVALRNMGNRIVMLESQINMLLTKISELEKKVNDANNT